MWKKRRTGRNVILHSIFGQDALGSGNVNDDDDDDDDDDDEEIENDSDY